MMLNSGLERTIVRLSNMYSPIIIEAGRRADYSTLAEFEAQVLSNRLEIFKTVNTQDTRVVVLYEGTGVDPILFNAANPADVPTVGGEYINYSHPLTFDSPVINSQYNSGIVDITVGEASVRLDFTQQSTTQETT